MAHVEELMQGGELYQEMSRTLNPYGDGKATWRILDALRDGEKGEAEGGSDEEKDTK